MQIRIANRIRLVNPPAQLKEYLIDLLRVVNPKYKSAIEMGFQARGIPPYLFNFELQPDGSLDIPRGMRRTILKLVEERAFGIPEDVVIKDDRQLFEHVEVDSSQITLRNYQSTALVDLLKGGPEGMLVSKAGSGKTVMGLSLIPMLGQPMLWCTHTSQLVTQVIERLAEFLPSLEGDDIGMIGGGKWKIGNKFTVATIQTLARRPEEAWKISDRFGIVVVDECHHVPASTFTQVVGTFNPFYLYGLTATPIRTDGLETLMAQTMGPVTASVSMETINKAGGIIIPTVIRRNVNLPNADVLDNIENYQILLKSLYSNPHRNAIIVRDILDELANDNICIVITERKVHAETLYNNLKNHIKGVGIATGDYTNKVNKATIADLDAGKLSCLIATSSLLGEGFDCAKINRAFTCLPIRNEVRTEQIVGRIQRTSAATGKTDAIIYDYVDTHGMLQHQFDNRGDKGCRSNVYKKLGCKIIER